MRRVRDCQKKQITPTPSLCGTWWSACTSEEMDAIMSGVPRRLPKKQITPTKTNIFAQYVVQSATEHATCVCLYEPLGETFRERLAAVPPR